MDKAIAKSNKRKRVKQRTVDPRSDDYKTTDLDIGMKFELFWEPSNSWSNAEIKWNWGDGSYVVKCDDDTDKANPLTYYIDQYKYRYDIDSEDSDDNHSETEVIHAPKRKRRKKAVKSDTKTKKKTKTPKKKTKSKSKTPKKKTKSRKKKRKPVKAKVSSRKTRSKKKPAPRKKKITVRKEPNYARLRIEKLFENEVMKIEDCEDSFTIYDDKILDKEFGLRRLSHEAFRAVNISDEKLMKSIFLDKRNISDPYLKWSVDVKHNCLDYAIRNNNVAMVELLLKFKRKQTYAYNRIALPSGSAQLKVSSGHTGAATFGHKVRKVKASRGGKEGNNAFIKDEIGNNVRSLQEHFEYALELGTNYEIIFLLMKELHRGGMVRPIEQICDNGLLHKAAAFGHLEILREFMNYITNTIGNKAIAQLNDLHSKVLSADDEDLDEFKNVSAMKKANDRNSGITPLHLSCINPNIKYLQQMIEQCEKSKTQSVANVIEHCDGCQRTPIFFAAACNSPEPIKYLISKGAKLDVKGWLSKEDTASTLTPLLIAVKYGKSDNLPHILEGLAAVGGGTEEDKRERIKEIVNEAMDKSNKKLLHIAAFYGRAKIVSLLLEYGANPKCTIKGTRMTPLHFAAQFGYLDVCKVLVEHSCSMKNKRALLQKDTNKRIPLIQAIMNGHLSVVQYMLLQGAPAYCKDSSDNSAIHYAAAYGWADIVKCLIYAPFSQPSGFNMWKLTPFFIAMIKGNDLCASTLLSLDKNFDVNAIDAQGKSILHYMLENKNFNPAKSLKQLTHIVMELGANVNVRIPKTKETPLHVLANNGVKSDKDSEMAMVLMQKGARPDYQDMNGHTAISLSIKNQNFALFDTFVQKFDSNIAGKAMKSVDWKFLEEKNKDLDDDKWYNQENEESNALNVNTCLRMEYITPLILAIQLEPPTKTPQKPKERKRKKKKQKKAQMKRKQRLRLQHGSNIGGFVGSTFDQQLNLDMDEMNSDSSSSESEDEEEKLRQKLKEEAEERERNEPGETIKQRQFRRDRLQMIRSLCDQCLKYENGNANALNMFDSNGLNALSYAIRATDYKDTNGYDINYGSVEIIETLMEMGCDPNIMNDDAQTVVSMILENDELIDVSDSKHLMQILTPIINKADVNKSLVIYEEKDKRSKKREQKSDEKEEEKIRIRRDSYLTTAIQEIEYDCDSMEAKDGPIESTKYKVIKLLIEQGSKLSFEKEIPVIIQIISQCINSDELFESDRFQRKYAKDAGDERQCIGYELICLILRYGQTRGKEIDLNVFNNKLEYKSLITFVIELIKKECQSLQKALYDQINVVTNNYNRRDKRVIEHKKKLYRDRVLAIPLISVKIMQKLLNYKPCKIAIDEQIISKAIKLSSIEGTLKSLQLFDDEIERKHEAISLRVCKMLLKHGKVNLNTHNILNESNKVQQPLYDILNKQNEKVRLQLLKLLIKNGINLNRQDRRGPVLIHAIKKYDYKSIQLLVKNQLNVNNSGWAEHHHHHGQNSDTPNKIGKHPMTELIEMGAGSKSEQRYRPEMLDCILSQRGINVELQNEFCVTAVESDTLICNVDAVINHNNYLGTEDIGVEFNPQKNILIEFIPYKYWNETEKKWKLTKTFCVDHLALFAYKSAYQKYKIIYPRSSMEERFSSPLWKQSIEILINCHWSLSKATSLFKQFKTKLVNAIRHENNRRKAIREKYKRQQKFMLKLHKEKDKESEEKSMEIDENDIEIVESDSDNESMSSLDSEERNAINSDDEMKKMQDYKSELKEEIDECRITKDDLAPIVIELCKDWKYTKKEYERLVHSWYFSTTLIIVGDAAWQLCREQARNNETKRRQNDAIQKRTEKLQHLRQLRQQIKAETIEIQNVNALNFGILDKRDKQIKAWKKAKKHGEPPLIAANELAKITGVDCTSKRAAEEVRTDFESEVQTLSFAQKYPNKIKNQYKYEYKGKKLLEQLSENQIYYCILHNREQHSQNESYTPKSQSLGYVHLLSNVKNVKHKKHDAPVIVEIAKRSNCQNDALDLIRTYKKCGGDLSVTDHHNKTMIVQAIHNNNLELIEYLLSKMKDVTDVSTTQGNNLLHVLMKHIKHDRNLNIKQLLYTVINNVRNTTALRVLSNTYNFDGYTPLLLAIESFLESKVNTVQKKEYIQYYKHEKAVEKWEKACKDRNEDREALKKSNLENWYKKHPIDYTEIDLDEMDFDIVSAEWRIAPKPPQLEMQTQLISLADTSLSGIDPETGLSTTIGTTSAFGNLDTQDVDMLMSSQPVFEEEAKEEKETELKDKDAMDVEEDSDEERGPTPGPKDVTKEVKDMISNGRINIAVNRNLHEEFKTQDWNDKRWILEITYSVGDYFCTVFTEQTEEEDEEDTQNISQYGGGIWGGGFNNNYNRRNNYNKLTKQISIPKTRDRIKQVYHYRMSQLFRKKGKIGDHVLDHLEKNDGREHQTYVHLCKKMRIKPRFAYPIALRKKKSRVRDQRISEEKKDREERDKNDYYKFRESIDIDNDVLTDECESESDYELPKDPIAVVHDKKPRMIEEYSITEFLYDFVTKCDCDVNKQTKLKKSYLEKIEKERKEMALKSDKELIEMEGYERTQYFDKLKAYKLKKWNVCGPWQKVKNFELRFAGFSPLHYATHYGDFNMVSLFVRLGTNPNLISFESKQTALMIHCLKRNDTDTVMEIISKSKKKCDVNLADEEGFTALTYAINFSGRHLSDHERSFRETFQIERLLLKNNANINHIDVYSRSPAHYIFVSLRKFRCVGSRDPIELVSDLCSSGKEVDVNVSDMCGRTPMHYAAMLGAQISSNWLIKEGATVCDNADYSGNEPFQHSILNKQIALTVDYINQDVDVKHLIYSYDRQSVKSSFRHVLELKWMGVAYLMVSRGVEITYAVQDALETENYQLAKTLLYKTHSKNLHNKTPNDEYNLHHIVSKYCPTGHQSRNAFEDPWSKRIVEILDENKVDSNVKDMRNMTPLHYCVANKHCNLARYYIITDRLDPEKVDGRRHERPVITALYNNDINMIEMLLEPEINVTVTKRISSHNKRKNGNRYPIHIAVSQNKINICKVLLECGQLSKKDTEHDYDYKNRMKVYKNGDRTILHTAVRKGNYELSKLILEFNSKLTNAELFYDDLKGYQTCLHLAAAQRNKRLIELLIAYKCTVDHELQYSKESEIKPRPKKPQERKYSDKEYQQYESDMYRWKREYAQVYDIDGIDVIAVHVLCRRYRDYNLTKLLIDNGANVNKLYRKKLLLQRKTKSNTLAELGVNVKNDLPDLCLLHSHVRLRNTKMVELLLEYNANPNIKMCKEIETKYGEVVPLHTATRNNDAGIVSNLLKSKANPNELYVFEKCKNSDWSVLHTAIRNQNIVIVNLLLKAGSSTNQIMIKENSECGELYPIHLSVERNNIQITQNLLKHDANPNNKLNSKRTIYGDVVPIHIAIRHKNYAMAQLLLLYGANPNVSLQPKNEKEIIWKWQAVAGWKEYDQKLNILIEKQYQLYKEEIKNKEKYIKQIKKSNVNLTIKKKVDEERIKQFDNKIKHRSRFQLNSNSSHSFFYQNTGYFIDFHTMRQANEDKKRHRRNVNRYTHPKDMHKDGGSALWMAVRQKSVQIVSLLVDYHCDMNITNVRGETPLVYAIQQNDLTLAAILIRGAVYYNDKYKEKIIRGIKRRQRYSDGSDSDSDDSKMTETPPTIHKKKRSRSEQQSTARSKKRKTSNNTMLFIDNNDTNENKLSKTQEFVPINVCLKDKMNGYSAIHHCIMTDGCFNASYENETMLQLLIKGETTRTNHFLEKKVDNKSLFKTELNEQELKETDFSKPTKFKSKHRECNIRIKDKNGKEAMYYALLQKSKKMSNCLESLGARIDNRVRNEAQETLNHKIKTDKLSKLNAVKELYGTEIDRLASNVNVLSDARDWRKEFFVEDDGNAESKTQLMEAETVAVDFPAKGEIGKKGYVLIDEENGDIYNWDGLYVNVDKGKYGAYMFYKLQLLYQPIQKLTLLWCRWGRPGETGSFQRSPYQNKADAIKEFKKIFQEKTKNAFENRSREKFVPTKWRIVRKKRRKKKYFEKNRKDKKDSNLTPHNLVNSIKEILRTVTKEERPRVILPEEIASFIFTIFDTAALTQSRRRLGLTDDVSNLGYLQDEDLDKSYELIRNLSNLVQEQDEQNIKTRKLKMNNNKFAKQIRERNTKRDRSKNLHLRAQQRVTQEITRLSATIRTLKTKITNLDKKLEKTEEKESIEKVSETAKKTLSEKEKERTDKEEEMRTLDSDEEKRVSEEKKEFEPLDTSDNDKIKEIDAELKMYTDLTTERNKRVSHLSNEYYLLMPRTEFRNTYITAINNRGLVNKYLKIMMALSEHQIAISTLMGAQFQYLYGNGSAKINPIDYCYISLKCKMLPLTVKSYEFQLVLSYINRTASPVINEKRIKIYEIWKENEERQYEKYENYPNRMLLWHGSDTSNIAGILSKGLKIAPPEADATGYMFGKGVYFADAFQKSKNYASTGNQRNNSNIRCLFLCEVALGKMFEAITAEYMEEPKSGFNSTKGLGRKGPNPSHVKTTFGGEIVPDSPTMNYTQRTTRDKENNVVPVPFYLNWNEYVIYNQEQAKLKYLVLLE